MPDLVFVRANTSKPIKDGAAVVSPSLSLPGSSGIVSYQRPEWDEGTNPSGLANYAQAVLSTRNLNYNYYTGGPSGGNPYPGVSQPVF